MSELAGVPRPSLGIFTRRPAVAVALLLMLGILIHDHLPQHPFRIPVACAGFAILAAIFIRRRVIASICLAVLVTLLGVGLAQREHYQFAANDIGQFATDEPHLTDLEVQLLDDPQIVVGPPMGGRPLPPKQTVTANVLRIKTWNGWISATGQLPIQINQIEPDLQTGQTVQMLGMLQRPRAAMNPGEFDWAAYYRQQRILATFTINRSGNIHILSSAESSWIGWVRARARHALAAGFTDYHATNFALLDALLLGDRDPQLRDVEDEFKQTGMGYQLNVSGMHIAMLAFVFFWICRYARLRPRWTLILTTAFVLLYAGVSLPSHSGIRGAIFCVIFASATAAGRLTDTRQLLALAIITMLLWHPIDVYSVGFHLSFAVSIAFVIFPQPIRQWLKTRRDIHEAAKPKTEKPSIASQIGIGFSWFSIYGLIAWFTTLPLVAYHFGATSPWSLLGSLLLFPLVVLSLFAGVLKLLFTLLWPRWAGIWATGAGWPVSGMEWGVHQLARLPGSSISLPTPSVWLIVVYYLLLLAPLLPYWSWLAGRRRWVVRLAPLIGAAAIFSLSLWAHPEPATTDELKITLLSLGAGQCAVVEPPGGVPVLLDAGSSTVSDVARKVVEPFLRAEGQSRIDEIFLSHGDFDHISATGELAAAYDVGQILTSYHFKKNAIGNIPDEMLLDELEKLNKSPKEIAVGDHFNLGNGAAIDVLWPPKVGELNSNNAGLVLRLTYAGRSILFPADIQDPAFVGVLKNAKALQSDVLVAPHHGSSEDLTPAFLAAVHPQIILSSNFARLTGKQKRFETMTGHTPLYRTPECGAITVTIKKDGTLTVTTFVQGQRPKQ